MHKLLQMCYLSLNAVQMSILYSRQISTTLIRFWGCLIKNMIGIKTEGTKCVKLILIALATTLNSMIP